VSLRHTALLVAVNALTSVAAVAGYALWLAPAPAPTLAVLDVGELYRLKEKQVAAVLVKHDANDTDRAAALARAAGFGIEVSSLIQSLPEECHCLILARGAVVGPAPLLPDLTPEAGRRLGL